MGSRIYSTILTVNGASIYSGNGNPNGVVSGAVGSIYLDKAASGRVWRCSGGTIWIYVSGAIRDFAWIPGIASNPSEGIFGTFLEAHTAAAAAAAIFKAPVFLYVVGSAGNTATIETIGTYDMTNIAMSGVAGFKGASLPPLLIVPDGVRFENPENLSNLSIIYQGTGTMVPDLFGPASTPTFVWGPNLALFTDEVGARILEARGSTSITLLLKDSSIIDGTVSPAIELLDTSSLSIVMFNKTELVANSVTGDATSNLFVERQGSSTVGDQATYPGTYTGPSPGEFPYLAAVPSFWALSTGGVPPTSIIEAANELVRSQWLFGSLFDPQNALSVGQGSIQIEMGANPGTSTLVGRGLMANFAAVQNSTFVSSSPTTTYVQRTLAVIGSLAYIHYPGDAQAYDLQQGMTRYTDIFAVNAWTGIRFFSGFSANVTAAPVQSDAPVSVHIGLQFSSDRGDTTFQISVDDGSGQVLIDTLIAPVNNKYYRLEIAYSAAVPVLMTLWDMDATSATPAYRLEVTAPAPPSGTYFSGIEARSATIRNIGRIRLSIQQRMNSMFQPA